MKNIVAVQDVYKNYTLGTFVVPALRGVSLDVAEGEFLAIAGPSGSGKTTLLNLIGCVDTPSGGSVAIAGNPTGSMSERELTRLRLHTIGFIFQSFNLVSVLSVFQNVELPLLLQRSAGARERRSFAPAERCKSRGSSTFWNTLSTDTRLKLWKMKPMVCRRNRVSCRSDITSVELPAICTVPAVGVSTQPMRLRSVVLPLPDGPAMDKNSPSATSSETPRSAGTTKVPRK